MAESRFHSMLRMKLLELKGRRIEALIEGVVDYPTYTGAVSYIRAIDDVLNLCDETEREYT